MTLTTSKNTMRLLVAASCCAVVASEDCTPNSNSCSCFNGTKEANIVAWRKVLDFNTCCEKCVFPKVIDNGCLNDNSCEFPQAKAVFEACGAEDWPAADDPPAGFLGPQSCELFEVSVDNVVNWRQTASEPCQNCLNSKLKDVTIADAAYGYSVAQTAAAFLACGKELTGIPDPLTEPVLSAFVPPQSLVACEDVPVLTPDILSNWRTILGSGGAFADCGSCLINRLRGGEAEWNKLEGVVAGLGACGYDKEVPEDLVENIPPDFTPPGCGEFTTGSADTYAGIVDWSEDGDFTFDCDACTSSWAFGTAKASAPNGYPGTCVTQAAGGSDCDYDDTRDAFNYCGSDPEWPEELPGTVTPELL